MKSPKSEKLNSALIVACTAFLAGASQAQASAVFDCSLKNAALPNGDTHFSVALPGDQRMATLVSTPSKLKTHLGSEIEFLRSEKGEEEQRIGKYTLYIETGGAYSTVIGHGVFENGKLHFDCGRDYAIACYNDSDLEVSCTVSEF